jgi:hypothetical protein
MPLHDDSRVLLLSFDSRVGSVTKLRCMMSSSSSATNRSTSASVRDAVAKHGLPCIVSALVGGLLAWKLATRSGANSKRAAMLQKADATATSPDGLSPSQWNAAAHDLVDQVTEYRATLRDRPSVKSTVQPGYLKALVPAEAPENGEEWSAIQGDIERVIMPVS